MNLVLLLAMQSTLLAGPASGEDRLPRFGDLEPAPSLAAAGEPYPWIGIEPMAMWTAFESGLHIKDAWGFGADGKITLDWDKSVRLSFRMGALGWNTRTDPSPGIPSASVDVRQYRVGINGEFPVRFLEFRIGANFGGMRFRRENHNDTAGFFEFQGAIGARPNEFIWIGVNGMMTFTVTDFNHNQDHSYTNFMVGPAVEFRF